MCNKRHNVSPLHLLWLAVHRLLHGTRDRNTSHMQGGKLTMHSFIAHTSRGNSMSAGNFLHVHGYQSDHIEGVHLVPARMQPQLYMSPAIGCPFWGAHSWNHGSNTGDTTNTTYDDCDALGAMQHMHSTIVVHVL